MFVKNKKTTELQQYIQYVHTNRLFDSSSNMPTPFHDVLRGKEYTGPQLVMSQQQCPPYLHPRARVSWR